MWRKGVAAVIAIAASIALYRRVLIPYQCNIRMKRADAVRNDADTFRARQLADRNVRLLRDCTRGCSNNAALLMLAAYNLHVSGRHQAEAELYRKALTVDRRPELYFNYGLLQLEMGAKAEALASFVEAADFAGSAILADVPDAEVRWDAFRTVAIYRDVEAAARGESQRRELISNGNFEAGPVGSATRAATPGNHPSAASRWFMRTPAGGPITTSLGPSSRSGGRMMHVRASATDSGVFQIWTRPVAHANVTAWVYVKRGQVYLVSSNGREVMRDAMSSEVGRWELLRGATLVCPAAVTAIYAAPRDGAEFYVAEVRAVEVAGPPCEQ